MTTAVMKDAFVFNQGNNCRIKSGGLTQTESMNIYSSIFTTVDFRLVQLTDDMRVLMEFVLKLATQVCRSLLGLVTDTPTWALCKTAARRNRHANPNQSAAGGVHDCPQHFLICCLKRRKNQPWELLDFIAWVVGDWVDLHLTTKQVLIHASS